MTVRGALTAALISFVLTVTILALQCSASVSASNEALTVSLENEYSLLYRLLEQDTSGHEDETVSVYAGRGRSIWLQNADGRLLYTNGPHTNEPALAAAAWAERTEIRFARMKDRTDTLSLFASRILPSGSTLVVYRPIASFSDALRRDLSRIIGTSLAVTAAVFTCVFVAVYRRQHMIDETVSVITSIADGETDKRLNENGAYRDQRREINFTLNRLNDRVFRQRTQNEALSSVLNLMQHGILAVDSSLNVILVTPAAKKLLGIKGRCEGRPVAAASKDVKLDDVLQQAMRQGNIYTNEVAARTTEGRGHRPLRLYVSPMKQDDQVIGALAMIEDISELRSLEQVRTDFAANVSHELKTPLTSIRGFVETLMNGAIDRPELAHKFLKIIMLETERLTRLINDVLSISKLESGQDDVPVERIRIDKMAFDAADMLSIHASETNVTIHAHEKEEPVWVIGNHDRVEQMLINLIENGIKYNKNGGSVTVQVFSDEKNAYISIADTGIGIAEENIPRLFERFYRVDKGRSRSMGGTGLGLAIVKHIIISMGGEIEVSSKLGEGTEFLVTLPLAPESEAPEADIAEEK